MCGDILISGIGELDAQFTVFPNPVSDQLVVAGLNQSIQMDVSPSTQLKRSQNILHRSNHTRRVESVSGVYLVLLGQLTAGATPKSVFSDDC